MNKYFLIKSILLIIILVGIMVSCEQSEELLPSSTSESIPSEAPSDTSTVDVPDVSLSISEADASVKDLPSSSEESLPSSITSSPPPISSEPSSTKIVFVKSNDKRLQFSSSIEAVGNAEDIENCEDALSHSSSELGLLIVYNGENGPREYTDEFIDGLLDIYRRTNLSTIDKISDQHPSATTRGISAAAFYGENGNRLWVVRALGELFRIELGDNGKTLVFGGTLGM